MQESEGFESSASGFPNENGKPVDKRTKRHLSTKECKVLLDSLKELIANGQKSDNGFRAGYLNKLEDSMKKEFPGTDLKGMPHLHSKIQTWKRNYNSLVTMLSRSGIGFKDNMIECTDQVWDEIVKSDPNAKSMRRRTWQMFEDWKDIFGKDRANGEQAEDILDAVNDLLHKESKASADDGIPYHVKLDDQDDASTWEQTTCGSGNGTARERPSGAESGDCSGKRMKKRRTREDSSSIAEVLREISRDTNARLEALVGRIGHEHDMDELIKEAFGLLDDLPQLSLEEKFVVCDIFGKQSERLLIFKGLPASARPHYVARILKEKRG